MGLAFYRVRHSRWMSLRGIKTRPKIAQPKGCAYTLWLAHRWKARSYQARLAYQRWYKEQLRFQLRDFASWRAATHEVQRVFPGTEPWLNSCSDAEGWRGWAYDKVWYTHGWGSYYPGFEDLYIVGGPMQFKWPTFKGMYRHALEYALAKGFKVPRHLLDPGKVRAWLSMLGQAMAAGWARLTGNDNSHWSASWGNGC